MIDCIGFGEKKKDTIIMCMAISVVELYKFGTKGHDLLYFLLNAIL